MDERLAALPAQLEALVGSATIAGAVTLVWQAGAVIHRSAVGWRNVEAGLPMQNDTIFRIASMTKPITTVAALMLVEQGRMALTDPIARWLPEFADMSILIDPQGPLDAVVPARRAITILDLMTHRSGLAYSFSASGPIAEAYGQALGDVAEIRLSPHQWLAALGRLPLLYQPGERMHYGHSTEVLGYLVERVAGVSFPEFLRAHIFAPLGMRDTAFHVPADNRSRLARIYRAEEDGLRAVDIPIPQRPPIFCAGGGMLVSTADDYLAFARLLLGGGAVDGVRLLDRETVTMMRTNQLSDTQRAFPFLGKPYWRGMGFGLGLGIVTDPARHAWMGPGHAGAFTWPGVWGTWWQADPQLDAVLLYMIQNVPASPAAAMVQDAAHPQPPVRPGLPLFQKAVYGDAWSPAINVGGGRSTAAGAAPAPRIGPARSRP